jgi:hypothetical protein
VNPDVVPSSAENRAVADDALKDLLEARPRRVLLRNALRCEGAGGDE